MPSPSTRRLAGIQFVDATPNLPEKLPRLDIAVFIGFASAGPLHTPVVLEDAAQFSALFGDDLFLAWDSSANEPVSAHLGPAVRAFFRNGGRRCWVVRVGGIPAKNAKDIPSSAPETNVFPLPGIAQLTANGLQPAFALARSPGSWFDVFRTSTALLTRAVEALAWTSTEVVIPASSQAKLVNGDLLKLTFPNEDTEAYLIVEAITPESASSPPRTRPSRYSLKTRPLGFVRWLSPAELLGFTPLNATWRRLPETLERTTADVILPDEIFSAGSSAEVRLAVSPSFRPPTGTFLKIAESPTPIYFIVERLETMPDLGSPPTEQGSVVGRAFVFSTSIPASLATIIPNVEVVTFELRSQQSEKETLRLLDLGFTPGHPRYWNILPNDDAIFGSTELTADTNPTSYTNLVQETQQPRFPLAGGPDATAVFLPIGMRALPDRSMAAANTGREILVRDGLETFSSALFFDPRLKDSYTAALMPDADFIRYQTVGAPPLRGIHAALGIEEATLIAIPDAIHRHWHQAKSSAPTPPIPSAPVPHPRWWHFLPCNPPALPLATANAPERGQFLDCALRVIERPTMENVDGPDPSGAYRVNWSSREFDAQFILEEATQPDFSDAVSRPATAEIQHTFLARDPGLYYYRVRAEAEGESSDWSDGVVVAIGPAQRWELDNVSAYADDTLLDIHRALLRFCAARSDIVAILSLPNHLREVETLAYTKTLKNATDESGDVFPLGASESRAFSYATLYHPWVIEREAGTEPVRHPPDGTVVGTMARRTLSRGAWVAPANDKFVGVLALQPLILPDRRLDLLLAQVNLLRQEPHGFVTLNADTLSDDPDLRPLNIRRLLILLRRAALSLGNNYVFEPNDLTLRRIVRGAFESLLQRLFMRGAFAGTTADTSYRVVMDESINTPQAMERGQFFVDLKVAPALPLSFITVRLVRIGEQATAVELL
jgi:hypothetical protein